MQPGTSCGSWQAEAKVLGCIYCRHGIGFVPKPQFLTLGAGTGGSQAVNKTNTVMMRAAVIRYPGDNALFDLQMDLNCLWLCGDGFGWGIIYLIPPNSPRWNISQFRNEQKAPLLAGEERSYFQLQPRRTQLVQQPKPESIAVPCA